MGGFAGFVAGVLAGLAIGLLLFSNLGLEGWSVYVIAGAGLALLFAGYVLGKSSAPQPKPTVRLTGRVFSMPQAPLYVEIALRRAGSILSQKPTVSE